MSDVLNTIDSIALPTDSTSIAAKKFKCIYDKLTQSPKFKDLFIDIFGVNNDINAKFKIVSSLPSNTIIGQESNATTKLNSYTVDGTGNINSAEILIKINQKILTTSINLSNIEIARTIIHECIHAFLMLKRIDCSVGITLDEINNFDFPEVIENYYDGTCQPLSEQHNFMINYMIPTMQIILEQIKDSLIPAYQQQYVINNPFVDISGNIHSWDWTEFYFYVSLQGLSFTQTFEDEVNGVPRKLDLYNKYKSSGHSFSKNCL